MHYALLVVAVTVVYVMPFSFIAMLYKREVKRLEDEDNGDED